jgi:hypothetical protein
MKLPNLKTGSFPYTDSGSLSRKQSSKTRTIRTSRTFSDPVIEPVSGDLSISIPKMNKIPDICPIRSSKPLDVPSGTGRVISAPN